MFRHFMVWDPILAVQSAPTFARRVTHDASAGCCPRFNILALWGCDVQWWCSRASVMGYLLHLANRTFMRLCHNPQHVRLH